MGGCATKPRVVKVETEEAPAPPPEEEQPVEEEVAAAVTAVKKSEGGGGGEGGKEEKREAAVGKEAQGSIEGKLGKEGWHQDETKRRSLGILFQESDNSDSPRISSEDLEKSYVYEKHSSGAAKSAIKVEAVVESAPVKQLIVNDAIAVGDVKPTVDISGDSVQGENSDTNKFAGSQIKSREVEALLISAEEHPLTEISICERSLNAEKPLAKAEATPEIDIPLVLIKEEHPIAEISIPEGQPPAEKSEDEIKKMEVEQKLFQEPMMSVVETTDILAQEGTPIVNESSTRNELKTVEIEAPLISIQEEELVKEKHLVEPEIKVVEIETVAKSIQEEQLLLQKYSKTGSVDVMCDEFPGICAKVVQTSSKPSEEVEMNVVKVEVVENIAEGQHVASVGGHIEEVEAKTAVNLVNVTEPSKTESSTKESKGDFVDIVETLTSAEQSFKEKEIIVESPVSIAPVTPPTLVEDKKIDETSKVESNGTASKLGSNGTALEIGKAPLTDKTTDEIVKGSSIKIEDQDAELPVSSSGASA